jgi:hypothetical protein
MYYFTNAPVADEKCRSAVTVNTTCESYISPVRRFCNIIQAGSLTAFSKIEPGSCNVDIFILIRVEQDQ